MKSLSDLVIDSEDCSGEPVKAVFISVIELVVLRIRSNILLSDAVYRLMYMYMYNHFLVCSRGWHCMCMLHVYVTCVCTYVTASQSFIIGSLKLYLK